jgi:heme-degrading monooxygenase HmoA
MILETAILCVKPGFSASFEADFATAGRYISSIEGYLGHSLHKCLEQSDQYLLLVQWRELEDHTVGFRESAAYLSWKKLLHHYYEPFPTVEHYVQV